jgi:cytochrome c-type biogenesis protein CcmH
VTLSRPLVTALLLLVGALAIAAAVDPHSFSDPAQEAQYRGLIKELRCLVCQNQNLADSDADLAKDLRGQVYDMVKDGRSDGEVVDYMVARYGDFVLYRPPLQATTALLWAGPFLLIAMAILILVRSVRRRASLAAPPSPEPDDAGTHVELGDGDAPR